ncbi:hypothetical protein AQUCO_00200917v1 [Aquilegia coerulea]|uniref:DSBA-like thioredoxin domain-containing protein n=1 Tax=Aquilegia coerulea TaxID=218851 RepID=A0A2G5F5F7_AQUCA|nr:hypothetical protein AQUCO_00200917v1 [Aquilegia coerulea]
MATSVVNNGEKKLIRVDISSDTVCSWCLIGKRNLDKAMDLLKDQFDFEVRWHPFFLNPSAPKEGLVKEDLYREKMGPQFESAIGRMTEVFRAHGLEYNLSGLTGNTMDSHRIMAFAGHQGLDKQHALAEELFLGYFTQGKYIGDRGFLVESAEKVGVQGAAEFLEDPDKGVQEVYAALEKYSGSINGVPYYVINGKHELKGGQPPEVFLKAIQEAAEDST